MSQGSRPIKGVIFKRDESQKVQNTLLAVLYDDVARCEELLEDEDTQFARRGLVRAAFAFHEGFLCWLKEVVSPWLLEHGSKTGKVDITRLMLLGDDVYRPDERGKVISEPSRTPFKNYCAFVIRTGAECTNIDPGPLFSDNGWQEMQKALGVRHRITHPKRLDDLNITDGEIDSVRESLRWLYNILISFVNNRRGSQGDADSDVPGESAKKTPGQP